MGFITVRKVFQGGDRENKKGITRALYLIMCILGIDISLNNVDVMNMLLF